MVQTPSPLPGARLLVDLDAIVANWRLLGSVTPRAETGAAVKADAYGHGLEPVVGALAAAGCRSFFTAWPEEGAAARAMAPAATVYVLNGFLDGWGDYFRQHRLTPVLGSRAEIDSWLRETGGQGEPVALHVDTGINRLGLRPEEAAAVAGDPEISQTLKVSLVMSHFACADEPGHPMNARQLETFADVRRLFPAVRASLANSAGIALGDKAHHDLTRPGINLYGGRTGPFDRLETRPAATFEGRIVQLRDVPAGETVGYGAGTRLDRRSRLAIVCAGYADGLHRRTALAPALVRVGDHLVPLVGRVSMDLFAVDVTDLPAEAVRRGDAVEIFGPDRPVDALAAAAGTIGYELLTAVGRRVPRVYRGG